LKWHYLFIATDNSCCAPQFPLITSYYKIVDSQTLFTLRQGVGAWNFGKVGVGVGYFAPRLRNPALPTSI